MGCGAGNGGIDLQTEDLPRAASRAMAEGRRSAEEFRTWLLRTCVGLRQTQILWGLFVSEQRLTGVWARANLEHNGMWDGILTFFSLMRLATAVVVAITTEGTSG